MVGLSPENGIVIDPDVQSVAALVVTNDRPKKAKRKRNRTLATQSSTKRPSSSFLSVPIAPRSVIVPSTAPCRHWQLTGSGGLRHWTRAGFPPDFLHFRQIVEILRYTDQEYASFLISDEWNRSETDQLLDLTERYDRRFIVITDRLSIHKPRSVEQVKFSRFPATQFSLSAGFYSIQCALIRNRMSEAEAADHLIIQEPYDFAQETFRKAQLKLLFVRSAAEERQAGLLCLENHRLEQAIRKRKLEQNESRRVLKVQKSLRNMSNSIVDGVVKRRSTRPPTEEEQSKNPFGGLPDHVVVGGAFPPSPSGVFLRHAQLMVQPVLVNQRLQKQLDTELEEVGCTAKSIQTPTDTVCEMFDRLRQDYLTLFNLQRYVARKEQDTNQLKADLEASQKLNLQLKKKKATAASSISKPTKLGTPSKSPAVTVEVVESGVTSAASVTPSTTTPAPMEIDPPSMSISALAQPIHPPDGLTNI